MGVVYRLTISGPTRRRVPSGAPAPTPRRPTGARTDFSVRLPTQAAIEHPHNRPSTVRIRPRTIFPRPSPHRGSRRVARTEAPRSILRRPDAFGCSRRLQAPYRRFIEQDGPPRREAAQRLDRDCGERMNISANGLRIAKCTDARAGLQDWRTELRTTWPRNLPRGTPDKQLWPSISLCLHGLRDAPGVPSVPDIPGDVRDAHLANARFRGCRGGTRCQRTSGWGHPSRI